VEVVVEAPLETVQSVLGRWGTVISEGTDLTRIEMDTDDLSWPVMFLAALNAKVHTAEPAELRDLLQDLAEHFKTVAQPHRLFVPPKPGPEAS
jgi:predicted DNA-binding transcriptional regulator YafY